MAYEIPDFKFSLPAGSDLSAAQFRFVTMAADGEVDLTGAGNEAEGVLQDKPDAQGRVGEIMGSGISKVEAGAAVARGALVASDATGRAIVATTGDIVLGKAYQAAGGAAEIIPVRLYGASHVLP